MSDNAGTFTHDCGRLARQLVNVVVIEALNGKTVKAIALWDTVASVSCISDFVIDELKPDPNGVIKILTPSGDGGVVPIFPVKAWFADGFSTDWIRACKSEIGRQEAVAYENGVTVKDRLGMIIGMDVIGTGDFAVSNFNGTTKFTFRRPSLADIDFD